MEKNTKKAIIAMSGGVDSAVAAYLIKQEGYESIGITLKLFDNETIGLPPEIYESCNMQKSCCSLEDVEDARTVARKIGIPHYVFNFGEKFKDKVIDKFADEYSRGLTPNPCIDCNRYIKFDELLNRAESMDFDYVVTGHYAIVEYNSASERYLLKKAKDKTKDQSYVLFSLTQKQLSKVLFPLGEYEKVKVREIAEQNGFINAKKRDSQDICFVKDGNYRNFLELYRGKTFKKGPFVDVQGNLLGMHKGIAGYTIGQRKGLGISSEEPYYVVKKDVESNTVILGREGDLYSKRLSVGDTVLTAVNAINSPIRVNAKTRYSQAEAPATIFPDENGQLILEFDKPQRAITLGQAVVFYSDEYVVGGGTIIQA